MTPERDPIADLLQENVLEERPPQTRGRRLAIVFAAIGVVIVVIATRALVAPPATDTTLPPVGGGDPEPPTTETTEPPIPPQEGRRRAASAAGDGLIVLFGGEGTTSHHVLGDAVISRDGGLSWSVRFWLGGPGQRVGASLTHVTTADAFLLFGGTETNLTLACPPSCASIRPLDDLWVYRPADDSWSELTTIGPLARAGHGAAFDPAKNSLVVFGGINRGAGDRPTDTFPLDDTWVYDLAEGTWTRAFSPDNPPALVFPQMIHHPETGLIYLWGGRTQSQADMDAAVWAFDTGTFEWTRIDPPDGAPPSRWFHSVIVLDDGRLLVTGGMWLQSRQLGSGTTSEILPTDEAWFWDPSTNTWTQAPSLPGVAILHVSGVTESGPIVTWGDRTLVLHLGASEMTWTELGA
ncbi:MAG TPA: kelch repeat-containing protein [Acidimicrobiia bacterium]|nr:kelch repeat-containing protein [Acidimicrobiia bacterium]